MATKPKSTKEYLAALPPERRAALKELRDAMMAAAPQAEEGFGYGIPALKMNGKTIYWYAAWTLRGTTLRAPARSPAHCRRA